jgi:hypothetical protein
VSEAARERLQERRRGLRGHLLPDIRLRRKVWFLRENGRWKVHTGTDTAHRSREARRWRTLIRLHVHLHPVKEDNDA